jgi:sphingolipid delta-4 desaturase
MDFCGMTDMDFEWSDSDEPHATRRRQILSQYPEIRELFGYCPRTKYIVIGAVVAQLFMAYLLREASWVVLLVSAYIVGGVLNHALSLALHELAHNLGFKKPLSNRVFSLFANLPMGLPAALTFRHYHLLHHRFQGLEGVDTDLPTALEGRLFSSSAMKAVWLFVQPLFYALRPFWIRPKSLETWEIANLVVQLLFDFCIWYFWGLQALLYLPLGAVLAMGLHPVAGHFISEHYTFVPGQETYSYYGPLNKITFNVGYHNEHHDFPYIPGSRLPLVRQTAPEFYNSLHYHTSWIKVLWDYMAKPEMTPFRRIKRMA